MNLGTRSWLAVSMLLLFLLAGWIGGPAFGPDRQIAAFAAQSREAAPALPQVSALITRLGGAAITLTVGLAALLLLLSHKKVKLGFLLAVTILGERLLVDALKGALARPRPLGGEYLVESMAFPSGHAANSMTVYLAITLLALPPRGRRAGAIAAIALSLLIGVTRIILGVHWTSDVIGGWALGIAAAMLAVAWWERSALPLEAKHEVVGGHLDPAGEDQPL